MATVAEEEQQGGDSAAAAEAGAAAAPPARADSKGCELAKLEGASSAAAKDAGAGADHAEGGLSAALDVPFTPMTLAFRYGVLLLAGVDARVWVCGLWWAAGMRAARGWCTRGPSHCTHPAGTFLTL